MVSVNFDGNGAVYPLEVVRRAVYELSGEYGIAIRSCSEQRIDVQITGIDESVDIEALKRRFWQLLDDYALRSEIARQTEEIRSALITSALGRPPQRSG